MVALIACILSCAGLVISFKIFEKFGISSLQAIVVNYIVAAIINLSYAPGASSMMEQINEPWFINGCILGGVFIVNLIIMGLSAQKMGASVTSVASKMSLVITVVFGVLYFKEGMGTFKIIGIILALISVFFIVQINTKEINRKFIFLPLILFIGGGFIDSFINYNKKTFLNDGNSDLFAAVTFGVAFIGGLLLLIPKVISKKEKLNIKSIGAGIILGGVNWLTIFTLLLALEIKYWDSSTIYTTINIGILLVVVSCGVLVFKEKLTKVQWMGVLLALASIVLVSIA